MLESPLLGSFGSLFGSNLFVLFHFLFEGFGILRVGLLELGERPVGNLADGGEPEASEVVDPGDKHMIIIIQRYISCDHSWLYRYNRPIISANLLWIYSLFVSNVGVRRPLPDIKS